VGFFFEIISSLAAEPSTGTHVLMQAPRLEYTLNNRFFIFSTRKFQANNKKRR
jgi:hypothetical protein